MRRTIWKYKLADVDVQTFHMPNDAAPLCVQMQGGKACLWVRLTPDLETRPFHIWFIGTGNPEPSEIDLRYVGTIQTFGGALVWHVFWQVE